MDNSLSSFLYKIGSQNLNVLISSPQLILDPLSGSFKFLEDSLRFSESEFLISYSIADIQLPEFTPAFSAGSFDDNQISYEWDVYELKEEFIVLIRIKNNPFFNTIKAGFNFSEKQIKVDLQLKHNFNDILFDPFFQPLGPILINYIVHHEGGIMLHSSGVKDGNNGYVFTAVSGTGKSTMAGLWQRSGAQIINDDRLILMPEEGRVMMTNTPMPYYQDVNKESPVSAIFLIKQSPENYLKPMTGAAGVAGLMSNCIQFLYDKKMVQKHMSSLTAIAEKCPVYELGFKPDTEIVEIIRSEF